MKIYEVAGEWISAKTKNNGVTTPFCHGFILRVMSDRHQFPHIFFQNQHFKEKGHEI